MPQRQPSMPLRRRANGIGKVAVWEWSRGVLTDPADPTGSDPDIHAVFGACGIKLPGAEHWLFHSHRLSRRCRPAATVSSRQVPVGGALIAAARNVIAQRRA